MTSLERWRLNYLLLVKTPATVYLLNYAVNYSSRIGSTIATLSNEPLVRMCDQL